MSSQTKPRCFGDYLRYPSVICMSCRVWRECMKEFEKQRGKR
ncbi:MAG: hypothetical protein QXZ02_04085 [Candidatus Bathyarchaeia archaeon]